MLVSAATIYKFLAENGYGSTDTQNKINRAIVRVAVARSLRIIARIDYSEFMPAEHRQASP